MCNRAIHRQQLCNYASNCVISCFCSVFIYSQLFCSVQQFYGDKWQGLKKKLAKITKYCIVQYSDIFLTQHLALHNKYCTSCMNSLWFYSFHWFFSLHIYSFISDFRLQESHSCHTINGKRWQALRLRHKCTQSQGLCHLCKYQ